MAGAKVPLTFRLYKGDQFVREEKLSLPVIKVGKLSSSHLRLDDDSVSRMHAVIEVTGPGDVSIIDLGSTKGTFVNGQKVNKAKLQSGDLIVVGDTRIEVTIGGADEDEDIPTRVQQSPQEAVIASTPKPAVPASPPLAAPPEPAPPAPPAFSPPPRPAPPAAPAAPPPSFSPPAAPSYSPPAAPSAHSYSAPPGGGMRPPPGIPSPFGAPAPAAPMFTAGGESVDDLGGARAVEVAAMLGDSVVTVKHCMNPKGGGKVTTATYALFAAGAAMVLVAAIAFTVSVQNAAFNKGKYDHWVNVQKRPSYAFRPTMLSLGYDWMMFGGLAMGLVALTYGLVRYRNEKQSPFFRIGQDGDVEFATQNAPAASFPLVAPLGDDFVFNYGPGMDGDITVDGKSTPLAELAGQGRSRPSSTAPGAIEVPIPNKARIRVRAGQTTFLVSAVPAPRRHVAPLFASLESRVLAYFAGSAAVHLGIWLLLRTIGPDAYGMTVDLASLEEGATQASATSQEDPPPPEPEETEDDGAEESGGTGTAMALEEGLMGKKESDRKEGQYKMQKTQEQEQLARQAAVEAARSAGVLGSSALAQGGAFASLTGTGDISSGFDDVNIYGGLLGDEAGEMYGGFGFGRSGFGPGGGGTGWGTIGTGRYGTIGHGSGTGSGYGVGGGRGGMRGRTAAVPQVRIGQPSAVGDLDKAIIRRYIKRNISKITYCYEKQLLAKPGLQGTVATQFFISPNGTVASSNASGVDGEVSSCVAAVIKSIEFPKPKGGGGVQVNYPFTFRPTGG
jgi:pSer/pThr/pTyr-binding forkhead associated (FHA) protein